MIYRLICTQRAHNYFIDLAPSSGAVPLKRKRQDGAETAHHRFSVFAHAYSLFKFGDNGYYSSTKQTYWTFLRYVKVTHSLTRYATFYNHFVVE